MDIKELFKRDSILFEASGFGNVVFLSTEDKNFIREIGLYAFDNFHPQHGDRIQEAADQSALFRMLKKESNLQLKEEKSLYWTKESYDPNQEDHSRFTVGTVSKTFKENEGVILRKSLNENNIFLYLPVVENWLRYYIPKSSSETVETREVLRCSLIALTDQGKKRQVVTFNNSHDLVETVNV